MLICGTYPIRNAITVDFGVSTANATSAASIHMLELDELSNDVIVII
jgi:hypothetical protein